MALVQGITADQEDTNEIGRFLHEHSINEIKEVEFDGMKSDIVKRKMDNL